MITTLSSFRSISHFTWCFITLLTATTVLASSSNKHAVKYEPMTVENMADSYNFIIHGDWGWNSINQSLSAYEMGVYGQIIKNKFVIALGDNVSDSLSLLIFYLIFYSFMVMVSLILTMNYGIQPFMISSLPHR